MSKILALLKSPARASSPNITSYDLIKALALITMVADHIGVYFFPENLWWTAVGRSSAPIWLFLIGFARSRDISPRLWIGAVVLFFMNFVTGTYIFPANILFSILLTRLIIDKVASYMLSDVWWLVIGSVVIVLGLYATSQMFEYGTLCVLIALWGYMMRSRVEGKPYKAQEPYFIFTFICYFIYSLGRDWTQEQMILVFVSCIISFLCCYFFKPAELPKLAAKVPGAVAGAIKIFGRWTLELYIAHLVIFKLAAAILEIGGHDFLQFEWFKPS